MEGALGAVRFLTTSENRLKILESLVDTEATRKELQEETDGSRSTVARILQEAENRGWVRSRGSQYWLTPHGRAILMEITDCLENIEVLEEVGETVELFPRPLFSLDVRNLRDAEIIETAGDNPTEPFTRSLSLFRAATEYRGLTNTSLPEHARVLRERVEGGSLDFQHIIEQQFLDELKTMPERKAVWDSVADQVWVYDGTMPMNCHIVDETVLVWLEGADGEDLALLESDNVAVLSWTESLFSEYKTDAQPL